MNNNKAIVYFIIFILIFVFLADSASSDTNSKVKSSDKQSKDNIYKFTLENGLRVLIKPKNRVPLVTTFMNYKVGSAYESSEYQGVSHFIEHLMFKGTDKFKKGEIDKITQLFGGENNAFTSSDYTAYHFQFPKKNWLKALEIESNRMRNCLFDEQEFKSEREVVIEEINEDLDDPWSQLDKFISPYVYGTNHGYGHAILGSEETLKKLTPEKVKKFYDTYYHPDNAVLVIVGAVEPKDAMENVKKYFNTIPAGFKCTETAKKKLATKVSPAHGIYNFYKDVNISRVSINFITVPITHADYAALVVLDNILSSGESSRIQKEIVENSELAQSAGTWNYCRKLTGEFGFWAEFNTNKSVHEVIAAWEQTMDKICKKQPENREVQKTINQVLSNAVFSKQKIYSVAKDIGYYATLFDKPEFQSELIEKISAVTAEQVQNVAKKYFDSSKAIIAIMAPKPDVKIDEIPAEGFTIKKFTLANGLTVELVEEHDLPMIAMSLNFHLNSLRETKENNGVFNLLGQMLTQGTDKWSAEEISQKIDYLGVKIDTSGAGISAAVLSKDFEEFFEILGEMVMNSTFPESKLELKKKITIADLKSSLDDPSTIASKELTKMLYPDNHPYGIIETVKNLQSIQTSDLVKFYKNYFVPNNATLRVVGDIQALKLYESTTKIFNKWKAVKVEPLILPEISLQKTDKVKYVRMDDKIQSVIYIGHRGIKRSNPDYYALRVLDNILGTGAGFTDRLNADLRDTQGFAYSVWMVIGETARYDYGRLIGKIATTPENIINSIAGFIKHLRKIQKEPVTDEEIQGAKSYLTGAFPATFESYEDLVNTLDYIGSYKLGYSYFKDFSGKIENVTKDDILRVAKKYLHPDALCISIAGNINSEKDYLALARKLLNERND